MYSSVWKDKNLNLLMLTFQQLSTLQFVLSALQFQFLGKARDNSIPQWSILQSTHLRHDCLGCDGQITSTRAEVSKQRCFHFRPSFWVICLKTETWKMFQWLQVTEQHDMSRSGILQPWIILQRTWAELTATRIFSSLAPGRKVYVISESSGMITFSSGTCCDLSCCLWMNTCRL